VTTAANARVDDAESADGNPLLPQHAALLMASAIADEVADARGYRSVTSKAELMRLGFGRTQARTPALLLPVWGVTGEIESNQIRPDQPRIRDGKPVKYETPTSSRTASPFTTLSSGRSAPLSTRYPDLDRLDAAAASTVTR